MVKRAIASSVRLLAMMTLVLVGSCTLCANGQNEPDGKRKAEIISALAAHGCPVSNWQEATSQMRKMAADRGWQTHRVPDARVLLLLELGSAHSNRWMAFLPANKHLDPPYGGKDADEN
ncbi:Uncharacterised protein [uncultured archaeon]|nr:Uncharacterised protein [uncultured archaeon]